jgi:hypothetical protein
MIKMIRPINHSELGDIVLEEDGGLTFYQKLPAVS